MLFIHKLYKNIKNTGEKSEKIYYVTNIDFYAFTNVVTAGIIFPECL